MLWGFFQKPNDNKLGTLIVNTHLTSNYCTQKDQLIELTQQIKTLKEKYLKQCEILELYLCGLLAIKNLFFCLLFCVCYCCCMHLTPCNEKWQN